MPLHLRILEGTSSNSNLAEFSFIIINLNMIDMKVKDPYQTLLFLCLLPISSKNFRDTMIHGRDGLSLENVKSNLETKEKIDRNLTVVEGNEGVGLLVDRKRSKEIWKV